MNARDVAQTAALNELFRKAATKVSCVLGSPGAFIAATVVVIVWAVCGPYFGYSDAWQLVINTSTTIGTFLMLFVLQNSQNRDSKAINIKLDELLRAIEGARNRLADLEDVSDDELDKLEGEFRRLARQKGQQIEAAPVAVSTEGAPVTAGSNGAGGKRKNTDPPVGKRKRSQPPRR